MAWTTERIEALRRLHGQGFSPRRIAEELELSRNAVIGKAHRLGLSARAKAKAGTPPTVDLPWHHRLAVGLASWMCRYPFGDARARTFRFCGAPVRGPGESYCEEHHELCHTHGVPWRLRQLELRSGARKQREAA